MASKAYYGIQVTLTTGSTPYSLLSLLQAVDSSVPPNCRELNLQSDGTNGGASIYIGDSSLTTSQYGLQLLISQSRLYRDDKNTVAITNFYVMGSTNSLKLNVEINPA